MASPLVSVIVLNLNGQAIIGRCLDHLLRQTHANLELIVVDNGSSDGSLAVLEDYLTTGKVSVLSHPRNLGVAGGRNEGLRYARGHIVAFMDNDGYAAPTWLEESVRLLESDPSIGAVAPVVFFNKRKIILNGCGGTINQQGYGGDFCFNAPYEFAQLPAEVLYPMGCGMVIRRSVMEAIGPFDRLLVNYYDDTELGIRIWKRGFRVVACPQAWVDHDFGYSEGLLGNKALLSERNRIRTVLKYYPATRLPRWLLHERFLLRYLTIPSMRTLPFRVWAWNLAHLGSALRWRLRFAFAPSRFWSLVDRSWKVFPPPGPNNQAFRPDPGRATARLTLDGVSDRDRLNFGWYYPERDGALPYRWTDGRASAFVRLDESARVVSVRARAAHPGQQHAMALRPAGSLESVLELPLQLSASAWTETDRPITVARGTYECLLFTEPAFVAGGRPLGAGVAWLGFT